MIYFYSGMAGACLGLLIYLVFFAPKKSEQIVEREIGNLRYKVKGDVGFMLVDTNTRLRKAEDSIKSLKENVNEKWKVGSVINVEDKEFYITAMIWRKDCEGTETIEVHCKRTWGDME